MRKFTINQGHVTSKQNSQATYREHASLGAVYADELELAMGNKMTFRYEGELQSKP